MAAGRNGHNCGAGKLSNGEKNYDGKQGDDFFSAHLVHTLTQLGVYPRGWPVVDMAQASGSDVAQPKRSPRLESDLSGVPASMFLLTGKPVQT